METILLCVVVFLLAGAAIWALFDSFYWQQRCKEENMAKENTAGWLSNNMARNRILNQKIVCLEFALDKALNGKYRDPRTSRYVKREDYYKKLYDMKV